LIDNQGEIIAGVAISEAAAAIQPAQQVWWRRYHWRRWHWHRWRRW
jgi:hypothetical protein